jgi:hypothetical protein
MTENKDQNNAREQLKMLAENSYKQGFKDAQSAIADVFERLSTDNEEANNLYREISKVIRGLQILDETGNN